MISWFSSKSRVVATGALIIGASLALGTLAQNGPPPGGGAGGATAGGPAGPGGPGGRGPGGPGGPPPGMPSPAEQAIMYRQGLYTVIGGTFGPLGGVMQGKMEFKPADVMKRAERLAFLSTMVGDAFPDISKNGRTKAKPEIWTHSADFDKKVSAFTTSAADLLKVLKADNSNSAAFKKAAGAVGESCKGCHDDFKAK